MTYRDAMPSLLARRGICLFFLALACALSAHSAPDAPSLKQQIADIEDLSLRSPQEAMQAVDALLPSVPEFSPERIELLAVKFDMLGHSDAKAALEVTQRLDNWPRTSVGEAAAAVAMVLRADLQKGNVKLQDKLTTEALIRLPDDAWPRTRLRFLWFLVVIKAYSGQPDEAMRLGQDLVKVADQTGIGRHRSRMRSYLAFIYLQAGQADRAVVLNAEAMRIAQETQAHSAIGRAHSLEAAFARRRGDREGTRHHLELATEAARRAGIKYDEATYLADLSDLHLAGKQPALALSLAEQALQLARETQNRSLLSNTLSKVGLARVALGQFDTGKQLIDESIGYDERRGAIAMISDRLLKLGSALEAGGDLPGATNAYHRHRAVAAQIQQRDRQKAIVELQERIDAERRTRELASLRSESEAKGAQLQQRDLQQRLWVLLAATLVLSIGLLLVLHRRVRKNNQALESSNRQLLLRSSQDPLTGLANRRAFQRAIAQRCPDGMLSGSLFLIDIDLFKRINDDYGHAAGDAVLVELGRRLGETLREQDLIVRWGGEEFLVLAQGLAPGPADALALKLIAAIGRQPVIHQGTTIDVTGSLGFGTFPLAPDREPIAWTRALHLVDEAMYRAKAHGRNRACGVLRQRAGEDAEYADVELPADAAKVAA